MAHLSTYHERYRILINQRAEIDIDIAQLMAECFGDGHTIVDLLDMSEPPALKKRRKASAPPSTVVEVYDL